MTSCDNCNVKAHCCAGNMQNSSQKETGRAKNQLPRKPTNMNYQAQDGAILPKTCFWLPVRTMWSQPPKPQFTLVSRCMHQSLSETFDVAVTHSATAEFRTSWTNTPIGSFSEEKHTPTHTHLAATGKECYYFTNVFSRSDNSQHPDDAILVREISSSSALKETAKASSLHMSIND